MKSLPLFNPFATGLSNLLHLKSTRARLLALFVFVALLSTAAFSATSIGSVRGFFFGKTLGSTKKVAANSSSVSRDSVSLSSAAATDGALSVARKGHSATVLSDGKVLIVGGENQNGLVTEAEIFDPPTGSFSFSGNLNVPRADHSATRLSDGRVLIAGGRGALGSLNSTEIFDPTTGVFTSGPNLNSARAGHSATALDDGLIVFAGGDGTGSIEILDSTAGTSAGAGAMTGTRSLHSAASMLDGRVLFVGGRDADGNSLSSGEIFDPATSTLSDVGSQLTVARVRPHLRVLFDGKVQVIGGSDDGSLEVYDPQINAFGAYVHVAPEGDTCAGLPGQILNSQTRAARFHNGQSDATFDRSSHTMSELGAQAIVVGGANSSGAALNSTPVFNSSNAEISTDKLDYSPGQTVYISGRRFQAGETVRIKVHEDPHTPIERGLDVVADADGNFVGEYIVQEYDLRMRFLVGARGLSSGRTAQTSFTDASPGSLGNYATAGLSGVTAPTNIAPSNVAANVSFSNLTRGAGLTASAAADAFSSSAWPSGSSLTIVGNTDYYEFTVTPNALYQFSASELRVGLQRSGTGPDKAELRSSLDSYGSTIGSVLTVGTSLSTHTINLSTESGLQNSASAVTFRIYGYGSTSVSGTMRIQRVTSPAMVGLEVDGTVASACTAPTSATLLPASHTLKVGDTLTLNATVTGGTAPYNFVYKQGATTVATHNNINSMIDSYTKTNIVTTDAGSYTVEVTSSGCPGSGTATSGAASVTVDKRFASIAVSFLANPITYGGNTTVTATVTDTDTGTAITPTGTVTFSSDGGDSFSSATCNLVESVTGTASCNVTVTPTQASVHNISAAWPGDSAHDAPTDGSAGLTVNPKPVTANITVSNKTFDGDTTATITACTLSGVVSPDGTAEADCSFGSATANFIDADAGTGKTVNATGLTLMGTKTSSYSFDGTANTTANIDLASSSTVIDCSPGTFLYTGLPITPCTATVMGAGGLNTAVPVTYGNNTNVGTATGDASYSGDANHLDSTATQVTFSITKVTLSVNADHLLKTFGQSDPTPTWTYSGFVNSEGPTPAGLSGSASCSYGSHSNDAGPYNSVITCEPGTLSSTNYDFATGSLGNLTISAKDVTVAAENKARYYSQSDPPFTFTVSALVSPDTTLPGVTCGVTAPHTDAGTYTGAIACSGNTNTNYNVTAYNPGTLTVTPEPTEITLDSKTSGANFDCVDNKYTATLKDTITSQGLANVVLKLTIGTQSVIDTTDVNGLAEFTMILDQPVGPVPESVEYVSGLNANYVAPDPASRTNFNVTADVNVGPGTDATTLYTGSLFFWTNGPSSSTATLTLSATIKDTGVCSGDIATAKVSFQISTNGGNSFGPVSNAQNLLVGYVDVSDRKLGAASAISQYNIGNADSVSLIVRVVVSGYYQLNTAAYDLPITIGRPGLANSLIGGGKLANDGTPFPANGWFGSNSVEGDFSSYVTYNKKGANPQGQVILTVRSCNTRFGTLDPNCSASDPATHHVYWIKSNSISELSLTSGAASFGAKMNGYELLSDGTKVNFDSGNSIQLVFTPYGEAIPRDLYSSPQSASFANSNKICTNTRGCASIVLFRSAGGIWYSSSWGTGSGASAPHTYEKAVLTGCVSVGGSGSSTPTISAATAQTTDASSTAHHPGGTLWSTTSRFGWPRRRGTGRGYGPPARPRTSPSPLPATLLTSGQRAGPG